MNRERGNVLIIILGIVLILFVVGFFRSTPSFWGTLNYKTILRLPCGLTVNDPKSNQKASFPLAVDGYLNGCGWSPDGASGGTAQIFDGRGMPLTTPATLVVPADSTDAPYYFSAQLSLIAAPSSDAGYVLLRSTTGLLYSIPVSF